MDARAHSILTVCIGNVCRSPLAERLLRARLGGDAFDVGSAGVMAMVGRAMEPDAARELTERGGDPDSFAARQLTEALMAGADLVLTATVEVRGRVLEDSPGALRRTFTLREFAALIADDTESSSLPELVASAARRRSHTRGVDLDIVDPMGMGPEVHAEAADLIEAAVDVIVEVLSRVTSTETAAAQNQPTSHS